MLISTSTPIAGRGRGGGEAVRGRGGDVPGSERGAPDAVEDRRNSGLVGQRKVLSRNRAFRADWMRRNGEVVHPRRREGRSGRYSGSVAHGASHMDNQRLFARALRSACRGASTDEEGIG